MAATATKNREAAILKGIRAQMGLTQADVDELSATMPLTLG